MKKLLLVVSLFLTTAPALASEKTATFAVPGMTCALCPVTVKTAIGRVPGVKSVATDVDAKTATVVFDDALASPANIADASANAGYPATLGALK